VERVGSFACQIGIGEALSADLGHGEIEAVRVVQGIVFRSPVVVTEYLFVEVAVKMKRFDTHVRSTQIALEEAPEAFQAVRMDFPVDVPLGMVDEFMHEATLQRVVCDSTICIDLGTVAYLLQDFVLQSLALNVRHDLAANLAQIAVKNSHDGSLAEEHIATPLLAANLIQFQLPALVHVDSLSADKSLVSFDARTTGTTELKHGLVFHSLTEPVKEKPCRFLSDAESAMDFHAADAVLAVDNHPVRHQPFVESQRRILEDCSNFDGELLPTALAEPNPSGANESKLVRTASWALDFAVNPAEFYREIEGPIWVGEVDYGLLECSGLFHINKCI